MNAFQIVLMELTIVCLPKNVQVALKDVLFVIVIQAVKFAQQGQLGMCHPEPVKIIALMANIGILNLALALIVLPIVLLASMELNA